VSDLLVIGYGNELCGDDGLGRAAADAVAAWGEPGVRAIACVQLTPELAAEIATVGGVIFVDAALAATATDVALRPVAPAATPATFGHLGQPGWLLSLTRAAFGSAPPAWCVSVPAVELTLGEGLSATARAGLEQALVLIREVCRDLGPRAGSADGAPRADGEAARA
jgi:hydrogenase maturation protease